MYSDDVHNTVFFFNICVHLQILVFVYVCVGEGHVLEQSPCGHQESTLGESCFLIILAILYFLIGSKWYLFRVIIGRKWCNVAISCSLHSFHLTDCFYFLVLVFPFDGPPLYFVCYFFGIYGYKFFHFFFCAYLYRYVLCGWHRFI